MYWIIGIAIGIAGWMLLRLFREPDEKRLDEIVGDEVPPRGSRASRNATDMREAKNQKVTQSQIKELSDYLYLRYLRIQKGELFTIEGHPPKKPTGIMQIDSSVMLIAMDECVTRIEVAEEALRCVLKQTFDKMGAGERCPDREQIDLFFQRDLLALKEKNAENGWVAHLCGFALLYLFDVASKEATSEELSALMEMGAENVDEIWQVYAKTKNILGHALDATGDFGKKVLTADSHEPPPRV